MAQPKTKAQHISAITKILTQTDGAAAAQQTKVSLQGATLSVLKGILGDLKKAAAQQKKALSQAMGAPQSQSQARGASSSRSRSKSHSTRGRGRARAATSIKFKSKKGGMTQKPALAENKQALVAGLKKSGIAANMGMTRAKLQAKAIQAQRKKSVRKTRSGAKLGSSPRAGGVSPALKKDYNRVRGLMMGPKFALATRLSDIYASGKKAAGRQVVSQQMINKAMKPRNLDSFKSSVAEERYQMFLEFYKPLLKKAGYSTARGTMGKFTKAGRRMFSKSASKSKKSARKSVSVRFEGLKQQARVPYYVAPRLPATKADGTRRSPRRAPFRVLAVAGSEAPAFTKLSKSEQRRILNKLNGSASSLRAKGAPRQVDINDWFAYVDKTGKYKAPSKSRKSRKSRGRKSVATRYQGLPQSQRVPYYIAKTPTRRVKAPFVVRAIPNTGAKPFRSLARPQQQKILTQLNGGASILRGKGAPRKVKAQDLFNYYDKKGRWAPRTKKGSGNRR